MANALLPTLLVLSVLAVPPGTVAHGACQHEPVHTYVAGTGLGLSVRAEPGSEGLARGPMATEYGHVVMVLDSETGDCNPRDGLPLDWDGDYDLGAGGGAFGHGPWADWCGLHDETAETVTVVDSAFGRTVVFVTGANDPFDWIPDGGGQNTCLTDGLLAPLLDPGDCLSLPGTGTQPITCPVSGDGLLWVFVEALACDAEVRRSPPDAHVACANVPTLGTITSP
ncbi:MAG TPA: hypothetical protein VNX21_06790 [Candidatus Thermoplasmatota archaeon]|nr:hypothetical protein [Candidatus Thermoplasmatota archaeon]